MRTFVKDRVRGGAGTPEFSIIMIPEEVEFVPSEVHFPAYGYSKRTRFHAEKKTSEKFFIMTLQATPDDGTGLIHHIERKPSRAPNLQDVTFKNIVFPFVFVR